jgi:uncharacterized protein
MFRYLRRGVIVVATVVGAYVLVAPLAMGILATHRPRAAVAPADLGQPYEQVTVRTADGLDLAAWYVPSRNGAAPDLVSHPPGEAAARADARPARLRRAPAGRARTATLRATPALRLRLSA